MLDIDPFWGIVSACLSLCRQKYKIYIPADILVGRCYVADPPGTNLGGFYHSANLGYQYWYNASFSVLLNRGLVSHELRTIGFARSYLHDSFHAATFRSFRRAVRIPASSPLAAKHRVPEIYREQYGINFRNKEGISYSSPDLTQCSPQAINLNLLMDGLIMLVIGELLDEVLGNAIPGSNALEQVIRKELVLATFDGTLLPNARKFHNGIIVPTKLFIEHWGGDILRGRILRSMMSGKLDSLKRHFDRRSGSLNTWEKMFKQAHFEL